MDVIRYATPEEIAAIQDRADLTDQSRVLSYGGKDFAVLRTALEIDPMFFHPESSTRRRLTFAQNIETSLRLQGAREYYFNVPITDTKYMQVLKAIGAESISPTPEFRFKKVL